MSITSLDDDFSSSVIDQEQKKKTSGSRIMLDVGGTKFATSMTTLTALEPTSVLAKMFVAPFSTKPEGDGSYFIDRSGASFGFILNWLRDGKLPDLDTRIEDELLIEAEFYGLDKLTRFLQAKKLEKKEKQKMQKDEQELEQERKSSRQQKMNQEFREYSERLRHQHETKERARREVKRWTPRDCLCPNSESSKFCPYHTLFPAPQFPTFPAPTFPPTFAEPWDSSLHKFIYNKRNQQIQNT